MNVRKRVGDMGSGVTGQQSKNQQSQMKVGSNKPVAIKNAIGLKPTGGGYQKVKGAVSG